MSQTDNNNLATVIWIILVVIVFTFYYLLFRFLVKPILGYSQSTPPAETAPAAVIPGQQIAKIPAGAETNPALTIGNERALSGSNEATRVGSADLYPPGRQQTADIPSFAMQGLYNAGVPVAPTGPQSVVPSNALRNPLVPTEAYTGESVRVSIPLRDSIPPPNFGADDLNDKGSFAVETTRFHLDGYTQYGYQDNRGGRVFMVSLDDDMIRVVEIWSWLKQPEVLARKPGKIEETPVSYGYVITRLLPVEMYSHMDAYSIAYRLPIWARVWLMLQVVWSYLVQWSLRIAFYSFLLAIILAFYVPGSMNDSTNSSGKSLTIAIFVFVLLAVIFQFVFFRAHRLSKCISLPWKLYSSFIWVFLIVSFGLIARLLQIVLSTSINADDDSNNTSVSDAFSAFACNCPGNSANDDYDIPDLSDYSYQCNSVQIADANFETCNMNCGICGSTYYDVFVSFTVFGAIYLFMMLFLLHIHADCFPVLDPALPIDDFAFDPQSHMVVTLHGSKSFGYPVSSRLTVRDALKLEKKIAGLVIRNQEKGKRDGQFLKHMMSANSANRSASEMFAKGFEYLFKIIQWILSHVH
jgi:hypothetical protein